MLSLKVEGSLPGNVAELYSSVTLVKEAWRVALALELRLGWNVTGSRDLGWWSWGSDTEGHSGRSNPVTLLYTKS